uniref:SCP domain-containing protein n=1 Tax=Panagrellus redivivus TaxID=6233 RepID=A0A7E4UL67_PANRE
MHLRSRDDGASTLVLSCFLKHREQRNRRLSLPITIKKPLQLRTHNRSTLWSIACSSLYVDSIPSIMNKNIIVLFALIAAVTAFNIKSLIGEAEISHSGPTNALYGHETFFDEELSEHERAKRGIFYPQFQQKTQEWPNLLQSSEPPSQFLKMWITSEHNRYRQMVPATNMRMLYWSDELAASAQRHADRCDFRHSRDRVNVGENIWAAPYANYSDAITRWFQEVNDPRCGCNHAYKHCCGHYIQVVWAQSNLIGCGFSRCNDVWGLLGRGHRNVFVCHYNPQGNTLFQVPAFNWASEHKPRCSECPSDAPACYEGLCYKPHATDGISNHAANKETKTNTDSATVAETESLAR